MKHSEAEEHFIYHCFYDYPRQAVSALAPFLPGHRLCLGDLTLLTTGSPLSVHMHTSLRSSSKALCPLLFLYDLTVSEELADKCELPMDWGEVS